MIRRISVAGCTVLVALALGAGSTFAGNPSGSGQPNASCEDPGAVEPAGFGTDGFGTAAFVYAGSEGSHSADVGAAVSQYDVACYQVTLHH